MKDIIIISNDGSLIATKGSTIQVAFSSKYIQHSKTLVVKKGDKIAKLNIKEIFPEIETLDIKPKYLYDPSLLNNISLKMTSSLTFTTFKIYLPN